MAIRHIYGPQAGTLAGVAGAIGTGRGQQDAAKQQAELDRMTLGALLQDRSQQADFNFRAAGMYQNAGLQNAQMQNELQRQQIGLNMGAQQQAWNAGLQAWNQQANLAADAWQNQQQLAQREQLIQQEMQQKQFEYDLRNRSQAQAAYQDLTSQEQALQRALDDGFVTQEQYGQMRGALAQKLAGFDPQAFPRDSQWDEGQGIGEVWQQKITTDAGEFDVNYSRDQNGKVFEVDDVQSHRARAAIDAFYKGQAAQIPGQKPNAAKPGISMGDYGTLITKVGDMLSTPEQRDADGNVTVPAKRATLDEIREAIGPFVEDWQYRFDPNTPGPPGQQLGPGVSADWNQAHTPSLSPGRPANTQGMRFGGQAPAMQQGVAAIEQLKQAIPDVAQFASYVASTQPDSGLYHLQLRYPGGEAQLRQTGDPYDIHLLGALASLKQRAVR